MTLAAESRGAGIKYTTYAVRGASREAVGRETEAAQAACTRMARLKEGVGPQGMRGAERTRNMRLMSVTLDVSQLSGWLNVLAVCGVEGRAYDEEQGASQEAGAPETYHAWL
eukprot:scaffold118301_cov60-Phaeocystis_antarctica.AAC.2